MAQAQEVVQETFLKLWKEDPRPAADRIAPWLFTVCRNEVIDVLRKESRVSPLTDEKSATLAAPEENPAAALEQSQQSNSILKCVGELPQHQQEVVRLKFQEGLSYNEISQITGHSVSYVGVLLHQAMIRLRARLGIVSSPEKGDSRGP